MLGIFTVQAQGGQELLKRLTPSSPEAAALIKAINYPVNHAYGLINISVPIYTIEVGGISLPINISYHASGLKVHENIGLAGLGWTLNAEPMITRVIKGFPDELSLLNNSQFGSNDPYYVAGLQLGMFDESPDDFYFNIPGASGKFLFSRKPGVSGYTIETIPYAPIKIALISNTKFKITDEKGVQYFFGTSFSGALAIEQIQASGYTTSWKCTEIVSSNLIDTIKFEYSSPRVLNTFYTSSQYVNIEDSTHFPTLHDDALIFTGPAMGCDDLGSALSVPIYQYGMPQVEIDSLGAKRYYVHHGGTGQFYERIDKIGPSGWNSEFVIARHIDRVTFRGGSVKFGTGLDNTSNVGTARLDGIQIFDQYGYLTKELQCNYQYVSTHLDPGPVKYGETWETRRLLSSLVFSGLNGVSPVQYSFEYDPNSLPGRATKQLDLWGYYNGASQNLSLIQPFSLGTKKRALAPWGNNDVQINFGHADRNANELFVQASILKKITYPTGGYTLFEYESNKAINNATGEIKVVGGVRIKSKSEFDPVTGKNIKTTYQYGYQAQGGGYVKHWPFQNSGYNLFITERQNIYAAPGFIEETTGSHGQTCYTSTTPSETDPPVITRLRTIHSNALADISYSGGGIVGYPEVLEIVGNPYDPSKNYWTKYNFYFAPLGSNGGYETPMFIPGTNLPYDRNNDWRYGTLEKKTFSKYVGATLVSREERYKYDPFEYSKNIWVRSCFAKGWVIGQLGTYTIPQWDVLKIVNEYPIGYNRLVADTIVEFSYDGTADHQSIRSYDYMNEVVPYPTKVSEMLNNGAVKETYTRYPHDILSSGVTLSAPNLAAVNEMISKNMVSTVVEQEERLATVPTNKVRNNFIVASPGNKVIPENVEQYVKGATTPQRKGVIKKLDAYGNILEQSMDGDVSSSYYMGYASKYVIAEATNASWNEILFDSFEEDGTWSSVAYSTDRVRSGKKSAKLQNSASGEMVAHSTRWLNVNNPTNKKYKFSVWYYSDGPQAEVFLFMKAPGETNYYTHVHSVSSSVQHKWTLLEGDFLVPSNITSLNIRIDNNNAGTIWFDDVRLHPVDAAMTTYTYDPLIGMTSASDVNNKLTSYEYDGQGRLSIVRDQDRNVLKRICYSYAGQPEPCKVFYNQVQSQTFTRNNCPPGNTSGSYNYVVPAGTYVAESQAAANQLALNDISANGQNAANEYGTCTPSSFSSADHSGYYFSNSCNEGSASRYYVSMPAGQFTSTLSQFDADSQAQLAAQAIADQSGACNFQAQSLRTRSLYSGGARVILQNVSNGDKYYLYISDNDTDYHYIGGLPTGDYNIELIGANPWMNFYYSIACYYYGAATGSVMLYYIHLDTICDLIEVTG